MTRKRTALPFTQMTTHELARATAELDEEMVCDSFQPLAAEDQARWKRVRKRSRRFAGNNTVDVISVEVESGLLNQADELARKIGVTRAHLISRGLKAVLAAAGEI